MFGSIMTKIPMLISLWKGGKGVMSRFLKWSNLEGATSSQTTKVQGVVLTILALAVFALGFFVPELADEAVQDAIMLALVSGLGTILSRVAGYKDRTLTPDEATVMLIAVRKKKEKAWHTYEGSILDASMEPIGWDFAVDTDGYIIDMSTKKRTGDVVALHKKGTDDQSAARVKAFRDTLINGGDN